MSFRQRFVLGVAAGVGFVAAVLCLVMRGDALLGCTGAGAIFIGTVLALVVLIDTNCGRGRIAWRHTGTGTPYPSQACRPLPLLGGMALGVVAADLAGMMAAIIRSIAR